MHRCRVAAAALPAIVITLAACTTGYRARPVSFKLPSSYENAQRVVGVDVAAEAFADRNKAGEAFGFDVRGAGLLPVQVVFDNRGDVPLRINPAQTFLEDGEGNLWPILGEDFAYERVTKYVETKEIFKQGAYEGMLAAMAGAAIGAAVGVVTGEDVGRAVASGAAVGAAGGGVIGGVKGRITAEDAKRRVMGDFEDKSLQNRAIRPGDIAYGYLFFPGEAPSASRLRLQVTEAPTGQPHVLEFTL